MDCPLHPSFPGRVWERGGRVIEYAGPRGPVARRYLMLRRTRIVATLGPATDRPGVLQKMLELGLDVARINFSHGPAEEHQRRVACLRGLAKQAGRTVAVLADLPGPKLRVVLKDVLTLTLNQP